MSTINIECPHCQINLETPETLIGKEVHCPSCGKNFIVKVNSPNNDFFTKPLHKEKHEKQFNYNFFHKSLFPIISHFILVLSLILSIVSLVIVLNKSGFPHHDFEKDAYDAVRAHLIFEKEINSISDYFWRKNGDEILESLEIKEIKINGNWAVAFYKLSLGATEVKKTMILYKVDDGYWMNIHKYIAKDKCPENWYREMNKKIDRFEKDSGHFGVFDM